MTPPLKAKRASELSIEYLERTLIVPDPRNARTHNKAQLVRLQAAIEEFGFTVPLIVDERNQLIAGHARLAVAEAIGLVRVPCVRISHLTATQRRALAIADNKLAELAQWDLDALRAEFEALCHLDFPVELTGFETAEIDIILDYSASGPETSSDPADAVANPDRSTAPISQQGDCWLLGNHRLACGNALELQSYDLLLGDSRANMIITDPPFNVPIQGHVSGLGKTKHREFAMASGEMSPEQFTAFLLEAMQLMARFSSDGSLHFHFMDHRHVGEITTAGAQAYAERKTICVWVKSNGGMGSLYRSRHELIFVFKNGMSPHRNNVQLGKHGRYRTNVWEYAGVNSFGPNRKADLDAHPTVKPVAMIADAIRDCSKRGDIILDPFAGSGTILLAAERTGRRAAAIELDPYYVDTAVKRWQQATGKRATLLASGASFDDVAETRATSLDAWPAASSLGESSND